MSERQQRLEKIAQLVLNAYWDDQTFSEHTKIMDMNRGTEKDPWLRIAAVVDDLINRNPVTSELAEALRTVTAELSTATRITTACSLICDKALVSYNKSVGVQ